MAPALDPVALATRLAAITDRAACSDGERLAARQVGAVLRALGRRGARTQTVWVRPAGTAVAAAIAVIGVAGSVLSVDHPPTGLALAVAALVLLAGDLSGRLPLLRRLTVARATQNVVSSGGRPDAPVRLVITAACDTPRGGALDGDGALPRRAARLRAALHGHLAGRYGVLGLALAATAACCGARVAGVDARWLGGVQLVPTLVLLALAGLLTDAATARTGRHGANANASAVAVALALVAALDRRPPRALAVDLVIAGAGEAGALGMRRWVAEQRRAGVRAEQIAVLHLAPCGRGRPVWWTRDGAVLALRYHPQLVAAAAAVAAGERHLGARPHETRGHSGARAARAAGWPAIAVGCVDDDGIAPGAGRDADTADRLDREAMDGAFALALGLIARLDEQLAARA